MLNKICWMTENKFGHFEFNAYHHANMNVNDWQSNYSLTLTLDNTTIKSFNKGEVMVKSSIMRKGGQRKRDQWRAWLIGKKEIRRGKEGDTDEDREWAWWGEREWKRRERAWQPRQIPPVLMRMLISFSPSLLPPFIPLSSLLFHLSVGGWCAHLKLCPAAVWMCLSFKG